MQYNILSRYQICLIKILILNILMNKQSVGLIPASFPARAEILNWLCGICVCRSAALDPAISWAHLKTIMSWLQQKWKLHKQLIQTQLPLNHSVAHTCSPQGEIILWWERRFLTPICRSLSSHLQTYLVNGESWGAKHFSSSNVWSGCPASWQGGEYSRHERHSLLSCNYFLLSLLFTLT